jgi:NitT/TauT family transport system ATP-binding protein
MSGLPINLGYIPLLDAAPLIIARTMGFAEEEGLDLQLKRAPSWSTLRDMLAFGQVEAAQMLAPVPVAMALGLGGIASKIEALMVLSIGGTVIGTSPALAQRMRATPISHDFAFNDPTAAGHALIKAAQGRLRIGVPFPFSMHAELLYHWLGALGVQAPQALDVRTVPPPLMRDALVADDIDAFCVGEPWGSFVVEGGAGELLLPSGSIWSAAPEKILAVRHGWPEAEPNLTGRLMRAIYHAGRWLADPKNISTASEILARPDTINIPADTIERGLRGEIQISNRGQIKHVPRFISFHDGAATFPWRSKAAWIGARLAARSGLDRTAARVAAAATFRTDLYRRHLQSTGASMPDQDSRWEGDIPADTFAPHRTGTLIEAQNRFFDGTKFDPEAD